MAEKYFLEVRWLRLQLLLYLFGSSVNIGRGLIAIVPNSWGQLLVTPIESRAKDTQGSKVSNVGIPMKNTLLSR